MIILPIEMKLGKWSEIQKVTHDIKNVGIKCHLCSLPLDKIKFKKIQEKHKLIKDIANMKTDMTNCQCGEMVHIMCLEDINCIKIPNPMKRSKISLKENKKILMN